MPAIEKTEQTPSQGVTFHEFNAASLGAVLGCCSTAIGSGIPDQVEYLAGYLEKQGCRTIVLEDHYVDRDYMEDHALFYAKSLCSSRNYCSRAHFFKGDAPAISQRMTELAKNAAKHGQAAFNEESRSFSEAHYLGFMVMKPLAGCPVGRTVVAAPGAETGYTNCFAPLRSYSVHLLGLHLRIRGLAFQQQDLGVSACATTAIWSAFHKVRDLDELPAASPAQITTLAAKYSMPFGRAMPSEGLSTDQMCVAVQALGASPHLWRTTDAATARCLFYSIINSGMCCILIMKRCSVLDAYHAVSVAGMRAYSSHTQSLVSRACDDLSADLEALYINDDRIGPYVLAKLETNSRPGLYLRLERLGQLMPDESWELVEILLPMHAKVRLSFPELWKTAAEEISSRAFAIRTKLLACSGVGPFQLGLRVLRSHTYLDEVLLQYGERGASLSPAISRSVPLSRYIGVVRLTSAPTGSVDVLVDTTSTIKNPIFLATVALDNADEGAELAKELAKMLKCQVVSTL